LRVRVDDEEVPRAREVLSRLTGDGIDEPSRDAGAAVVTVRVKPSRAAEVNRALAESGIYASRIEAGNDLEDLFLTLTTTGASSPSVAGGPTPPGSGPSQP
jgi:hypothetical protein